MALYDLVLWAAVVLLAAAGFALCLTDYDIGLGRLDLSLFHQSPQALYAAYQGEADLPVELQIDSLFVGHRGKDTLVCTRALRLKGCLRTSVVNIQDFTRLPIVLDTLRLEGTTFHSDSMIAGVGIDVQAKELALSSPQIILAEGVYPLRGLRLRDAYVGIDLRDTPPDTTAQDTSAMKMRFEVPDGELRNVHFLLTPVGLAIRAGRLDTKLTADVGANVYKAERLDVDRFRLDVPSTGFSIGQARLRASYDVDKEAYDLHGPVKDVVFSPLQVSGEIDATGRGLECPTSSFTDLRVAVPGLEASLQSPMPLLGLIDEVQALANAASDSATMGSLTTLSDLTMLDTLRQKIPEMALDVRLWHGSPIQGMIDSTGWVFDTLALTLRSDTQQTTIALQPIRLHCPETMRMPSLQTSLDIAMTEGRTDVGLRANTHLTDGAMTFYDLCTDADLQLELKREGHALYGKGQLQLDSIQYTDKDLGNHAVNLQIAPSSTDSNALRADIYLDDIPLELVRSFVTLEDIDLEGAIRASATVDGLPHKTDISAEVKPLGVRAKYTPYDIGIRLGETPIVMQHNHIDLNGLPVYGVDSTYIALTGDLDLDSMRLDVTLQADRFVPVRLEPGGPFPVYGPLAADVQGKVTGPLDAIVADIDLTVLPTTDLTYPIDKKNLAQVKPHGTVHVLYSTADGRLDLGGRLDVDEGVVRYSPKAYPMMPFRVDSGSHVDFNGPIGKTRLDVSASQQVKSDVESMDEETRRVAFRTGVRVRGELDSIGLQSIGFFLEAPEDEEVTQELEKLDEDTREGLAATLLATGMYVGESNVAAKRDGYALSSIVNSRINAAMANSKMGKVVDIDISSGRSNHASGKTNDTNISISKRFLNNKLRITLGSTLTDNPEINQSSGLFTHFSADYKLTNDSSIWLRLYSQRDYNNVLEGELYKSGLAVRATKEWKHKYGLSADAGVAYRSNNSIGPDLTLKSTVKNIFGKGELFTIKGNGAYFWALRHRHPGDPKKTDTYKLGVNASLVFPYLHWAGDHNPEGDTRYMVGYQYENIAGGYGVHKVSGSFTYFIRSPYHKYITHAFTPFSLSVVMMKAETDSLLDKAAEYPQLIKVIAGNEFIPSVAYHFIYDDYRSKRAVNTFVDLGVKESGNLVNLICKTFGKRPCNQFVKLEAELRNKFNLTDQVVIATRLYAGTNIPLGKDLYAPLSEAFYTGGPNSLRASSPYAYGPGNFYSAKYNQNFFHAGDVKLEANFELRFPIVWKLYGAAFVDAGNVWNWYSTVEVFKAAGMEEYLEIMEIPETLYDGILHNPHFARQIALGTGAGLRLDIDGLVIRLDLGVGIHSPYQTYRYDKKGKPDPDRPIKTYFNMPSALDALRINFGIGYPF